MSKNFVTWKRRGISVGREVEEHGQEDQTVGSSCVGGVGAAAAGRGGGGFHYWNDIRSVLMVVILWIYKARKSAHIGHRVCECLHAVIWYILMSWGKSKGEREQMACLPLSEVRPFCLSGQHYSFISTQVCLFVLYRCLCGLMMKIMMLMVITFPYFCSPWNAFKVVSYSFFHFV